MIFSQIKDRFVTLGIVTDWKRFDQITETRNDVEHYYTQANKKSLESVIANAFIIVRDFIAKQLREDPLQLLGDGTWSSMLEVSEVYGTETSECVDALERVDWGSNALAIGVKELGCPSCGGGLLRPDNEYPKYQDNMVLLCRTCGENISAQTFVPTAIAEALGAEAYVSMKDGGETPYTDCPECGAETYVMDEGQCALCGACAVHTCARCAGTIPAGEMMCSPYCGYCEHMMNKDD